MNGNLATRAVRGLWRPVAGVAALVLLVLYSAGVWTEKIAPGQEEPAGTVLPAGVEPLSVQLGTVIPRIELVGTVVSEENIRLCARIGGYVQRIDAEAGVPVRKGQELILLDDREVREQLAGAEAQLKQAQIEYARTKQLFAGKATSEQALVAAESAHRTAEAQVERVRVLLSYARIAAPIDGVVIDRRIEVGDLAAPGQVLLGVYDPCRMRLEVPVPDRLVEKLPVGQAVPVRLDRPARQFAGVVSHVVGEVDPTSRTQLVKIRLEGVCGEVLPGTFGRLSLEGEGRPGYLLPESALYRVGQCEYVQVVEGDRVLRRLVRTGLRQGERVEILAGVADGDRVLPRPLREGD